MSFETILNEEASVAWLKFLRDLGQNYDNSATVVNVLRVGFLAGYKVAVLDFIAKQLPGSSST